MWDYVSGEEMWYDDDDVGSRKPCYSRTQSNESCLLGDKKRTLDVAELCSVLIDNNGLLGNRLRDGSEPDGRWWIV